jgi:pyruvate/oxaloacetate carboxyltransferase
MIANTYGNGPRENNALLSEMVQREFEALSFRKERYDLNHPEHIKELTKTEIRQIAREKVIQDICTLPCCSEECPSFGDCRENPDKCTYMGH